jgi:hypothetical protein
MGKRWAFPFNAAHVIFGEVDEYKN